MMSSRWNKGETNTNMVTNSLIRTVLKGVHEVQG